MVEKVTLYLTLKSSNNDEKMILESTKKNQTVEIKKSKEEFMRYLQDSTAFNDREKKHIEDFMNSLAKNINESKF
jgi:hypothetical protein